MKALIILIIGIVICDIALIYFNAADYCFGKSNKIFYIICQAGIIDFLMSCFSISLAVESYYLSLNWHVIIWILTAILSFACAVIKLIHFINDHNPHLRPRL